MYYLQSSYHSPDWGRFINVDAIAAVTGELLSANMFAYCVNNPVNMSDNDGDRPAFDSEEDEQAYKDCQDEQQEELDEQNAIDRLRGGASLKAEQKTWNYAAGKRERKKEVISKDAHKAKQGVGKPGDKNFDKNKINNGNFYDSVLVPIGRSLMIVDGVSIIVGMIGQDIFTGGVGISETF